MAAAVILLGAAGTACSEGRQPVEPPPPPPPPIPLEGEWQTGPSLPERIQEFHAAVADGRIHVAGGIVAGNVTSARAYRFDPATGTWERIADLPSPRHHMPLATVGDSVYAIGGLGPDGFDPQGNLWIYLVDTDEWVSRPLLPIARGASTAVTLDGKIYVIGGFTHSNELVAAVDVYDPATGQWSNVAPLPVPLDHLAAGVVNGRIYVTGGRPISVGLISDVVQRYDPAEDRWDLVAPLPAATAGHAAAVLGGRLHVLGDETTITAFDYHFAYDPAEDVWRANFERLPTARHGLAAAVVNGRLYAIGGGPTAGFAQTDVVEIFLPD